RLSLIAMLVNTNDAFVAINGARLPLRGSKEYYLRVYDAGTEKNTELKSDIPGPCCGNGMVRVPTKERIRLHKGIKGTGDLDPSVYGWGKMVAKIKITRIN
ncbi:MAG: spondin domain-containing protein, partial [Melioribacteraceae bacterium]|nr:spondin domain-containing protein [Melioribacteraceae bacterium]